MTRRAAAAALALCAGLGLGCAGGRDLGAKLANAAVPSHLPLVVACWEKELEASGFRGEYTATVDFAVTKEGKIRSAKVRKLDATDAEPSRDPATFRACIADALDATILPRADDANGPGFATPGDDLSVTHYVIAFVDASQKARAEARERSAHVLLGPRADRCQGLYTYDPPRDEVDLYTAVDQAEAGAAGAKGDPDQYARLLQKAYDLRLELRERLRSRLAAPDLPEANRKRLREAIEETETKARGIGAAIGCKIP